MCNVSQIIFVFFLLAIVLSVLRRFSTLLYSPLETSIFCLTCHDCDWWPNKYNETCIYVFVCEQQCATHIVLYFCFSSCCVPYVSSFFGYPPLFLLPLRYSLTVIKKTEHAINFIFVFTIKLYVYISIWNIGNFEGRDRYYRQHQSESDVTICDAGNIACRDVQN